MQTQKMQKSFNTQIVQLKVLRVEAPYHAWFSFNTKIVQLKGCRCLVVY